MRSGVAVAAQRSSDVHVEYSVRLTSGYIYFRLSAGRDTADGSVVMMVRAADRDVQMAADGIWRQAAERHQLLSIRFVRASGGVVRGTLDTYVDPTCGCSLTTSFSGTIRNDTVAGTFTSLHADNRRTRGRWYARLREARVDRESPRPD